MTGAPSKKRADNRSLLKRLSRERAKRPGETYGVPGSGETLALSIVTILVLLVRPSGLFGRSV